MNFLKYSVIFLWVLPGILLTPTVGADSPLRLNEEEVTLIVLQQNLTILATSFDPQIAQTLVTEVQSRFDTLVAGQVNYNIDRNEKTSIVFGTDNRQVLYEASVTKKFPVGVQGRMFLRNQNDTTNSAFATDPAFWETRLGFEARAPFLKNRFGKSDRGEVEFAQKQQNVTQEASLTRLDEQVYLAVTTYWNLVASYDYLRVSRQFLKRAQDFQKITSEKKIIGLSEDPDILAAQALVEEREVEILRAQNLIEDFSEQLKNILNLKLTQKILPKESLSPKIKVPTKAEIFETALQNRNDYQALLQEAKAKDVQMAVAKDQKLPSLDLFTSLELNSVDPSYAEVLGQTFRAANPNWRIGVDFNLSFENRFAKSALTRSKLEKAQILVRIKELENQIALQIFEALREWQLQRKETVKFGRIANLQEKKLDIEQNNFLRGRSSSDIIVRFQTDWLIAEIQKIDSELRDKLSRVDLRRIMSVLIPESLKKFPSEAS